MTKTPLIRKIVSSQNTCDLANLGAIDTPRILVRVLQAWKGRLRKRAHGRKDAHPELRGHIALDSAIFSQKQGCQKNENVF